MTILPPELHVISSWMSQEVGGKGFKIWNIGTPSKRSLICAILMSFLYSTSTLSIERKFKHVIEILRLEGKRTQIAFPINKINALRRRIHKFNPFKNRDVFYDDKHFLILLKHFETVLNDLIADAEDYASHDDQLLQAASDCLDCFIDVYETDAKEQKHFFVYRPISILGGGKKRLIIFKRTIVSPISSFESYGFGMSLKYALPMRIEAFSYFANAAKFPASVLDRFKTTISDDSNFLIGALSTCQDIVPYLYELPYLGVKLFDGGICIDPKQTDRLGLSAFYYCISTFDIPLLRLLYNHASNNFDVSENNVRNPNKMILTALQEIGDTLKNDLAVLNKLSLLGDKRLATEKIFRQFICFNSFQCTIVERILLIRERIADRDLQQQHIIISIIEEYNKFFFFEEESEHDHFKNYMTFSEYYDILDLFTSFLLFDNLVLLSHIVNEENAKIYTNVIRSLFLFILSHKMFRQKETRRSQSPRTFEEFEGKDSQLRFIPFCYRNAFKKDLMTLYKELQLSLEHPFIPIDSSTSKPKNIDIIRQSIAGLTEIETEFFATKLKSYMDIAKKFSPVNIFSLERILQVIGEFMCCSDINNTIFKFFLCSCLPEGLEKTLCALRNHCLSHYRNNTVQGRLNVEYRRNDMLKILHNEIRDLSFILEPITGNHFLRVREFMIEKGKKESKQKFKSVFKLIHYEYKKMLGHRKVNFEQNQKDYAVVSKNLFHSIYDILKQNNSEHVEELEIRLKAIIFLSNYIYTSLRQGDENARELKKSYEQLNSSIDSKLSLFEVKDTFTKALKQLELVYSVIFLDYDELSRFEGQRFSRAIYFIKVYALLLKVFSNYDYLTKISEQQMETELEREMSSIASSVFKMDEIEVKKIVNFSEKLIYMDEDNKTERGKKLPIIRVFQRVLRNKFERKPNTNECDLKFPLLSGIVVEMKDFDIFSKKEKIQISKKMTAYLNDSEFQIKKLAMELEITKLIMESNNLAKNSNIEKEEKELEVKKLAMVSDIEKLAMELGSNKLSMDLKTKLETKQNLNFMPEEITQRLKYTVMSQKMIKKCISKLFPKPNIESAIALLKSESDHKISINSESNVTNALKDLFTKTKPEIHRRMFLNIQWRNNLQPKIYCLMNQKLFFLINRIEELQKILIDDDEKVKHLWLNGKSAAIKQHTKVLMCQRFIKERETRSALEMLFFDCSNILEDTDLRDIWQKATNLFAGIDLRDFVSHGSPVVELVSSYLDPKDLPLELISKILMLIEDKTAMIALTNLWERTKATKAGELVARSTKAGELAAIIERNDDEEYMTLRKDITNCTRWEKYFNLLPLEYG